MTSDDETGVAPSGARNERDGASNTAAYVGPGDAAVDEAAIPPPVDSGEAVAGAVLPTDAVLLGVDTPARPPGMRVVLDARPLQEPARAPVTATYLHELLAAFDADPLPGESFALLLASDEDDPTSRFTHLDVVGRRLLPPTRLLRSGALAVDPFVVRGASLGVAWRADRSGAAGAVHHAVGASVPVMPGLPVVVTLLDLGPWELPGAFQRHPAARLGQRLRGRLIRDAAAVIVGTEAVASTARRLLRVRRDRLRVVPLAPRPAFAVDPAVTSLTTPPGRPGPRTEQARLGLPERYFVYTGRFDVRHDPATLLGALASLAAAGRPTELPADVPWPPRILIVGATPDDRAAIARVANRAGVGDCLAYAPRMDPARLAALVRGARAAVLPAVSEAAGLPAVEALASGTPVVASAVGALPEIVGAAGILVEPRDAGRLAAALGAAWADDAVHIRLAVEARERAWRDRRTWFDVALDTRRIYADVGRRR
jgi:glycosyltransferase involved in cell wall biosynthesis